MGEQFQVENYGVTASATVHGIKKYLGSGLIKGIGAIMVDRIAKKFALNTLEIIGKTPERLSEKDDIGPTRIAMITKAWEEQKEISFPRCPYSRLSTIDKGKNSMRTRG